MSEVEKQESQKTVVAFITGLLIGGLLVWVFSSSPANSPTSVETGDEFDVVTEIVSGETNNSSDTNRVDTTRTSDVVSNDGLIVVADQKAGSAVTLTSMTLPTKKGWVVVRDYMDGVPGNIIGAARYSIDEGLSPQSVELVRNTVSGSSYQVSFYSDDGDTAFKISEDQPLNNGSATFKAE